MKIELLVVNNCPHEASAAALLRQALGDVRLSTVGFGTRVISNDAQASEASFPGSPTFLIDGRDPFTDEATPAVACRLYCTPAGLSGLPDIEALRQALKEASLRAMSPARSTPSRST